jgi:hypothetical protein
VRRTNVGGFPLIVDLRSSYVLACSSFHFFAVSSANVRSIENPIGFVADTRIANFTRVQ